MIHYLSVHDLVWINTSATGEAVPFDYDRLEQCMAAQYQYGDSCDVPAQAAHFLESALSRRPFAYGNLRTAYTAFVTFLLANGYQVNTDPLELSSEVRAVNTGERSGAEVVASVVTGGASGGTGSLRSLVTQVFNRHAPAIAKLAAEDGPA